MRIAIVDDLSADRTALRQQLALEQQTQQQQFDIEEFDSGEAFMTAFVPGRFAAVFLDIYMGKLGGMEVAKQLYQRDPACRIVFLTTSREFMLESYAVHATYYLVKPFAADRLRQALDFCFPAPSPANTLPVRTKSGTVVLQRRDILYLESVARHGVAVLADRTLESTDSFASLTAPLAEDARFLSCGRGILLQMEHVSAQEGCDFIMDNGARLPISRRIRSEVLCTFQDFAFHSMEVMG